MSSSGTTELNEIISDLEKDLGLKPGQNPVDESKKKKEKKKKAPKPAKAAPAAADQPEITKLDIRVGEIVKVWKHETADKLYCEEIDVGEDTPRHIASGLVPHYSLEEMANRKVLVMCNLKARNLVGFKSHGMVLCAAAPIEGGGELVAFVEPPTGAKNGERVVFSGLEGEPISPAQVEKKKVLQKLGDDMKTDDKGVAMWKNVVFDTSAGPCTCSKVPNGLIR